MRARTHPGAEKHTKTSSSEKTVSVEEMKQPGMNERREADKELNSSGVSVKDVADQSAYEDSELEIAHQAANSDRNKR